MIYLPQKCSNLHALTPFLLYDSVNSRWKCLFFSSPKLGVSAKQLKNWNALLSGQNHSCTLEQSVCRSDRALASSCTMALLHRDIFPSLFLLSKNKGASHTLSDSRTQSWLSVQSEWKQRETRLSQHEWWPPMLCDHLEIACGGEPGVSRDKGKNQSYRNHAGTCEKYNKNLITIMMNIRSNDELSWDRQNFYFVVGDHQIDLLTKPWFSPTGFGLCNVRLNHMAKV